MPLERYFKLPEEKRQQLVSAARAEFALHGFEQASYNRIIERAGVSKGAMYYYFADKADLFGEVVERMMADLGERVGPPRAARDAEDFWRALDEWLERAHGVAFGDPELYALGRSFWNAAGAPGVVARVREQTHQKVSEMLVRGQRLRAVRRDVPLEMLAVALTSMLLGLDRWFAERTEDMDPSELEALSDKTMELCRNLVQPQDGTSGRRTSRAAATSKKSRAPKKSSAPRAPKSRRGS